MPNLPSPMSSHCAIATDEHFMRLAILEAETAAALGEVPIGAVIVCDGQVVARAYNWREAGHNPTAHAELLAIHRAASKLRRWRLTNCTLYVTIEPCPMCAGAILQARIDRLVYGAPDPKAGAVHTLYGLLGDNRLNHQVQVDSGVLAHSCGKMMQEFFRKLRT